MNHLALALYFAYAGLVLVIVITGLKLKPQIGKLTLFFAIFILVFWPLVVISTAINLLKERKRKWLPRKNHADLRP